MPIISVIVPVYNVEPFLRCCVDSILAQTFTDFELILVDDGSPDNCGAICDEYAKQDRRVMVIHQENAGVSSARNAGLDAARGEFIYFCDGDDYIEKDLLTDAVQAMDGYDMVVFNFDQVDINGSQIKPPTHLWVESGRWRSVEDRSRFIAVDYFACRIALSPCNKLIRRDIIEKHQLRYLEGSYIAEDMCYILCYLLHTDAIRTINGVYYHYVQHPGSAITTQWLKNRFNQSNENSKYVFRHLNRCTDEVMKKEYYPLIHLGIMNDAINVARRDNPSLDIRQIRAILNKDILDQSFFLEWAKEIINSKHLLFRELGIISAMRTLTDWTYYINGNYIRLRIMTFFIFLLRAAKKILKACHLTGLIRVMKKERENK